MRLFVSVVRLSLPALVLALLIPAVAQAQDADAMIASAVSAAPGSVSDDARVLDWQMNELRAGTNGWTCLPDDESALGNSPWCVNEPWLNFLHALMNNAEPTYDEVGIAYMLMGDSPICNSDPALTEEECGDDWVADLGAHMMMLIPDLSDLEGITADHMNGGHWVMWPGTPYAHLMIPIDAR